MWNSSISPQEKKRDKCCATCPTDARRPPGITMQDDETGRYSFGGAMVSVESFCECSVKKCT